MNRYRIVRTETVRYVKDFSEEELIELGVPAEVFEGDLDTTPTFHDELDINTPMLDALTEATERHGDVQGNEWAIRKLREESP